MVGFKKQINSFNNNIIAYFTKQIFSSFYKIYLCKFLKRLILLYFYDIIIKIEKKGINQLSKFIFYIIDFMM